jgi:hypothetical protein
MAVTVSTKYRSVSGDQFTRTIGYVVKGASSDIDALDAVELAAPATYDGLKRSAISIDEIRWPNIWDVTVTYARSEKKEPAATGSVEFSFDVGLESQTIKQSLQTIGTYQSGTAQAFNGAIDVQSDGSVNGVTIGRPVSSFTLTYYPTWAVVTDTWKRSVMNLCGKVNSTSYFGYNAGEVRFVGASGKSRNNSDWELNFRFEVRLNETNITIGSFTAISCDGWDVLWVYYREDVDATSGRYLPKPTQVNVERVLKRDNFTSVLGIP